MRALLVDDDHASRLRARKLLQREGYDVDEAEDGAAARELAARFTYDLIVLDFVLPDVDGLQLLEEWRTQGVTTPALALTGSDSEAVVEAFLRAGAHDVIEKSRFSAETLRAALDGLAQPTPFPGKGPRARAPPDDGPTQGVPVSTVPSPGRALVVDDTAVARRLAVNLLQRDGWSVDEAATAEAGLRKAVQVAYDVVLVDQLLPDVEGVGLLTELRRRGVLTPVIALTGHGDEKLALEFLQGGAVDFIPKETLTIDRLREGLAAAAEVRKAAPARRPR